MQRKSKTGTGQKPGNKLNTRTGKTTSPPSRLIDAKTLALIIYIAVMLLSFFGTRAYVFYFMDDPMDNKTLEAELEWCKPIYFKQNSALLASIHHFDDMDHSEKIMFSVVTSISTAQFLPGSNNTKLVIIQDNTNFIGLLDLNDIEAGVDLDYFDYPPGHEGRFVFPDKTSLHKADFESSTVVRLDNGDYHILVFSSGSGHVQSRKTIMSLKSRAPFEKWETSVYKATKFYKKLEDNIDFSGGDINIEGVCSIQKPINDTSVDYLRIFQRSNGKSQKHSGVSCDIQLQSLLKYLEGNTTDIPEIENLLFYNLEDQDKSKGRLTFTECTLTSNKEYLFLGALERTTSAMRDGPVDLAVIGIIDKNNPKLIKQQSITKNREVVKGLKPEAVVIISDDELYILTDRDTSTEPSEICKVNLNGNWFFSKKVVL